MNEKRLSVCELKKEYLISKVEIEDERLLNHLRSLMICPKEKIMVVHKSFFKKSFIIKVLEINYAIDSYLCDRIFVYDI